jgi:roadblock/LC7 domain-containing protein
MIGLDKLMKIKGVVAAGQLSENGKVTRKVGELPEDMMESSELCIRQNQASADFLKSLDESSEWDWRPLVGWVVLGGKYSVVVVGDTRVFVETRQADFNQLLVDLCWSEATGRRMMKDYSGITQALYEPPWDE